MRINLTKRKNSEEAKKNWALCYKILTKERKLLSKEVVLVLLDQISLDLAKKKEKIAEMNLETKSEFKLI